MNLNIFQEQKIIFLPDAIINITDFIKKKNENFSEFNEKKKKIIISAGRLTKQKNFTYLIDEFYEFCKSNNNYILYILGDGEEMNILKQKVNKKKLTDKVILKGYVDNVYKYFKNADLFVLSSKWEEVGFVIVEAAVSNLFVISSDCPNGPTEFLGKGKYGLLFENNKKGKLHQALLQFQNLKNKMNMQIKLKKNAKKYTMFMHFKVLKKILSKEI